MSRVQHRPASLSLRTRASRPGHEGTLQELRTRIATARRLRAAARVELKVMRAELRELRRMPRAGHEVAAADDEIAGLLRLVAGTIDFERDLQGAIEAARASGAGAVSA